MDDKNIFFSRAEQEKVFIFVWWCRWHHSENRKQSGSHLHLVNDHRRWIQWRTITECKWWTETSGKRFRAAHEIKCPTFYETTSWPSSQGERPGTRSFGRNNRSATRVLAPREKARMRPSADSGVQADFADRGTKRALNAMMNDVNIVAFDYIFSSQKW
jgi:hypothetical protein